MWLNLSVFIFGFYFAIWDRLARPGRSPARAGRTPARAGRTPAGPTKRLRTFIRLANLFEVRILHVFEFLSFL